MVTQMLLCYDCVTIVLPMRLLRVYRSARALPAGATLDSPRELGVREPAEFDDELGGICLTSGCEASIKAPVVRQSDSFEAPGVEDRACVAS